MRMLLTACALLSAIPLGAAPWHFVSGPSQTHLLELYTSEGCSSCPPAEAWLGGLADAQGLWRDFVPVAFHVSYWDHLGWQDRFASNRYTKREYRYAETWGSNSVYTPCLVLDGAEARLGGPLPSREGSTSVVGVLTVDFDGRHCRVAYDGKEGEVQVALLGAGLHSAVLAGENRGRTLHHTFVVLELQEAHLVDGRAEFEMEAPSRRDGPQGRLALAVWVSRRGEQAPRQAVGGWLE